MDKHTLKEIGKLWEETQSITKKLSNFTATKADEIKAINGREWGAKELYKDGDTIIYGDSLARCLHTNKGIEPTNKVYWELITVSDMILELIERVSALEQRGEQTS